jgi:hydrogenase expression/formation protein HypE
LPPTLMSRLLSDTGAPSPEVLLGPEMGEDACAIDLPGGVLVVATDPITFTGRDIGRFAVTVNANDVAVTGTRPRWFLATVLLPAGTTAEAVEALFAGMRASLSANGIALVGGHTEVTPSVNQPIVVGQMLGLAEDRRFIRTAALVPGHLVLQIGRAPVEGAAVIAVESPTLLSEVDPALVRAAEHALDDPGISVVDAALLAARLGAKAMHDPTEGGLAAGLHEMAAASKVRLRVNRAQALWWEPAIAVCRAVGADPWATLASGTLLAAFEPDRATSALEELGLGGHEAAVIAVAETGAGVVDTLGGALPWPERDELSRVLGER